MSQIYQLNSELYKVTGIQRVLLDLHEALRERGAKVAGPMPYSEVNPTLGIDEKDYVQVKSLKQLRNSVVIIHERHYLPKIWLANLLLRLNIKPIYIHHSEMYNKRRLSLFPRDVVAISDRGIRNLTEYFRVPRENITKIHNCVRSGDEAQDLQKAESRHIPNPDNINILYPARINNGKRQIEIVNRLRGRLDPRIKILFAGIGPNYDEFVKVVDGDTQFQALGFRDDIPQLMQDLDYMLLYSSHEGLPITLIEASMAGMPIITNDVGGNTEIVENGENGIIVGDWEDLISTLNSLPDMPADRYRAMSMAGVRIAHDKFNFELFKQRYNDLISKVDK